MAPCRDLPLWAAAGARHALPPKWMEGSGKLRRLRKETARIQAAIDAEFEVVGDEDRL